MKTLKRVSRTGKFVITALTTLAIVLPLLLTGKPALAAEESKKGEIYPQSDKGIVVTGNMDPVTFGEDGPRPKVTVDGQLLDVETYYYSAVGSGLVSSRLTGTKSGWYEVLLVFNHKTEFTDRFDNDVENITSTIKALGKFYVEPVSIDKCEVVVPDTLDLEHPLSDIKVIYKFDSVNKAIVDNKDISVTARGDVVKGTNILDVTISNPESFAYGTATIEANVDPVKLTEDNVLDCAKSDVYKCTFSGKPCVPTNTVNIKVGDETYRSDKIGVEVSYENNINAGTAYINVKGNVITTGEVKIPFQIEPRDINKCNVYMSTFFIYNGKAQDLNIRITTPFGDQLTNDNFKVECESLVKPGKRIAKIIGTGNLTGVKEVEIEIVDPNAGVTPVPTVTEEPVVTRAPIISATPTTTPIPEVTAVPTVTETPEDPKEQISAFVDRIYTFVLDREPEKDGAAFWSDELYNFNRTGAEVAQGFIFSPEFENRNTTDEEFIKILYKTFFDREADAAGITYWLTMLESNTMDRATVANGFIYSQEWADTCAVYGIRSGGELKAATAIEPTDLTYAFVERMYTTAMNRESDEGGKNYWAGELANFNVTGEQVGASFFLSPEMESFGLDDKEVVNRLYKTFMDRESDADGEAYWLGVLASGTPRSDVVFGFTRSPEFTDKCIEARILPY